MKTYTKLLLALIGSLSFVNIDKIYGMGLHKKFAGLSINTMAAEEKDEKQTSMITFKLSQDLIARIKQHRLSAPVKADKKKKMPQLFTFDSHKSEPLIQYQLDDEDETIVSDHMPIFAESKAGIRVPAKAQCVVINIPVYQDRTHGELSVFFFKATQLIPGTTYFIELDYEGAGNTPTHAVCRLVPADSQSDNVVIAKNKLTPNLAVI